MAANWIKFDCNVVPVQTQVTQGGNTLTLRQLKVADGNAMVALVTTVMPSIATSFAAMATSPAGLAWNLGLGLFVNGALDSFALLGFPGDADFAGDMVAVKKLVVTNNNSGRVVLVNGFDANETLLVDFYYSEVVRRGFKSFYRLIDTTKPDVMTNTSLQASTQWTSTYIQDVQQDAQATDPNSDWLNNYVVPSTSTNLRKLYKMTFNSTSTANSNL